MKLFLRSLFFWNAPVQDAFFGLTLFFVCGGLWFALCQLPRLSNWRLVQLNIMNERFDREVRFGSVV